MSRLVEYSVSLYRLLLDAYPAAFRQEYGDAMVQLFRDTARDATRQRGLLSLVTVWLRTLADFTISVIRQHRDKPAEASSESVLLRDLLQKWRRLGSDVVSVTAYSTWYSLHLLCWCFQRATRAWATLTVIVFSIWFASLLDPINLMKGRTTRVDLRWGLVQIEHRYDVGEPISYEQFERDLHAWWKRYPDRVERLYVPSRPWEFSFFSDLYGESFLPVVEWRTTAPDHYGSIGREPVLIEPCKSWRLSFPFGILPAFLLFWTIRVYRRRNAGSIAAMQSA